MPRLSDRAFQIVKSEIERHYGEDPGDQIERVILLARLESLRLHQGQPMTRIEIWEVLSDIAPDFNQKVLREAEKADTEFSPLFGVSMGVGAVAVLVAAALGMDSMADGSPTPWLKASSQTDSKQPNTQTAQQADKATEITETSAKPQVLNDQRPVLVNFGRAFNKARPEAEADPFETAKSLGWQAALKSQNPPHSAQHWGETAALWSSAIEHLDQVPRQNENYQEAQLKKKVYEQNLQEIRARQTEAMKLARALPAKESAKETAKGQNTTRQGDLKTAQAATINAEQTPRFSGQNPGQNTGQTTSQRPEDPLKVAKRYGWQAALASQNAPHTAQEWADISRLWQSALLNLDNIDAANPSYAEAQQVKARYQQNLSEIRDRYQQEQNAAQRVQSLNATLIEMDNSITPNMTKYIQLKSIMGKLKAIPAGTQAHARAQEMIANVTRRMNEIDTTSSSRVMTSVNE